MKLKGRVAVLKNVSGVADPSLPWGVLGICGVALRSVGFVGGAVGLLPSNRPGRLSVHILT